MLELNNETHAYTKDGLKVPGVTTVLRETGLIDFSKIQDDILQRALKFGSAVHKATELHDKGVLDITTLDSALEPYLEAWIKFLREASFIIEKDSIEEKVYSEKYHYAGKYDRIGILNDKRTIIDISTSVDFSDAKAIQTAAYQEAENEGIPVKLKVKQREVVLLQGNGKYKLASGDFFQKSDFSVFLACLTIHNWRRNHGK